MFYSKVNIRHASPTSDLEAIKHAVSSGHTCAVDQFGVMEFGLNDAGWPRNTISALARCQTMEQYKMLAARLVKTDVVSDKNQKLTLDERFKLIRPRYAQTPFEMEVLANTLAEYDKARIDTQYLDAQSKAAKVAASKAAAAEAAAASAGASAQ